MEVVFLAACLPALYPREERSCFLLLGGFFVQVTNYLWESPFLFGS